MVSHAYPRIRIGSMCCPIPPNTKPSPANILRTGPPQARPCPPLRETPKPGLDLPPVEARDSYPLRADAISSVAWSVWPTAFQVHTVDAGTTVERRLRPGLSIYRTSLTTTVPRRSPPPTGISYEASKNPAGLVFLVLARYHAQQNSRVMEESRHDMCAGHDGVRKFLAESR